MSASITPTDIDILSAMVHTPEADASDDGVAALLAHDPLGKIEDMTGNYRDKPSLGFAYVGVHGSRKDKVLTDRGDTTFSMDTQSYIDVLEANGYVLLSSDTVSVQQYDDPPRDESWYILAHPNGLILYFDTHHGQRNAAKVCYVWRPAADIENRWECTSSGHMTGNLWIGDHDAREAVIFNMERLRQNGKLLKSCPEQRKPWFISYWETPKDYDTSFDYHAISQAKIDSLPRKYQKWLGH